MADQVLRSSLVPFIFLTIIITPAHGWSRAYYSVTNFGAKADARTDSTQAFYKTWSAACASTTPATLYVPPGIYLLSSVQFTGPCNNTIVFRMDGTLLAPSNYWTIGNAGSWVMFYKVAGITVTGGTLDARAGPFWSCRISGKNCPAGARSLSFMGCSDVLVSGVTSKNSQIKHITLDGSNNVRIQNVRIYAPSWSPNTDGIHTQSSTGVTISKSSIKTGDDCISIGQGSHNFRIERIACGPGHGISIGSLGQSFNEDGVSNVTVSGAIFTGTQNGVRIKTWGRPSNGFARDIFFRNILIQNVYNPIIIDQKYCPSGSGCPQQNSGVKISGVQYSNIRGSSAAPVAVSFGCSASSPCTGIELRNIALTYHKGFTTSYCKNAQGRSGGVMVPRSCL